MADDQFAKYFQILSLSAPFCEHRWTFQSQNIYLSIEMIRPSPHEEQDCC